MKKLRFLALILAAVMPFAAACSAGSGKPGGDGSKDQVRLSLWTYPVGSWKNAERVSSLLSAFYKEYPDIRVSIRTVDYETGDSAVEEAIAAGEAPDLIFEGPERLVAGWGARGLMAELSDLWESEDASLIYESVKAASHDADGHYYIYPSCMTTHCMAVNRDLFEKADALKYLDPETHTWTKDGFENAVKAIKSYYVSQGLPDKDVAAVYCGGQGGDQGTRALVNNLCGGSFTDSRHTSYTVNSEANIRALEFLKGLDGIRFDPDMVGTGEIEKFCNEELAMAFCWNISIEITQTVNNPNLFEVLPMAFPTESGDPALTGGIWGFGIFDNGDPARIAAAKKLIAFMNADDRTYSRAVLASAYWPVRELNGLYANNKMYEEYSVFNRYLGDYYQVTPGWPEARTAWWNMLQQIGSGTPVSDAVAYFDSYLSSPAE